MNVPGSSSAQPAGPDALWNEVHRILTNAVAGGVAARAGWLGNLGNSLEGRRLGICLAIDLVARALQADWVAELLDSIPHDGWTDARLAFAQALESHPQQARFRCASLLQVDPLGAGDALVRVLELGDFITYYAGPTRKLTKAPRDVAEIRRLYFTSTPREGALGGITKEWTGRSGLVWVIPRADLREFLRGVPATEHGQLIYDALGLSPKHAGVGTGGRLDVVYIEYPADFPVPCMQPSSFDAAWDGPGYYLSHGPFDGWGRTWSTSGQSKMRLRERIHRGGTYLTDAFSAHSLGEADEPVPDVAALLAEGYRRLQEIPR